ncbi:MAG: UDP-glucose--hexose-1-phosphate uridylyltransferase [Desulfovibrio sp.]|nr:MAG: UDP-glucose--hexose-1-phosphate uridylyltransferase [Desulfovibrio sp.]
MLLSDFPHRRKNLLTNEWMLVSPHRTKRPWQGKQEKTSLETRPAYDPGCYLCPGNERAGGAHNPEYEGTFVFTNDFAALLPESGPEYVTDQPELFQAEPEAGICRVICFSPRHNLSIPRMSKGRVADVVLTWQEEYAELGGSEGINHVQIFENRGEIMGCSNPHPHGQIWANSTVPDIPAKEDSSQARYLATKGRCLLCDYLEAEIAGGERILFMNDSFVVLVPFWAMWPFETMILPREHAGSVLDLNAKARLDLADAMIRLGVRYDNLFSTSFPYSMGLHQMPTTGLDQEHWHWHMHYYPPLLRSATVRKFMVGYEMLATPQRDITPEQAATQLRDQSEVHYLDA